MKKNKMYAICILSEDKNNYDCSNFDKILASVKSVERIELISIPWK